MQVKIKFIIPLVSGSQRGNSWADLFAVILCYLLGFIDLSVTELLLRKGLNYPS